MSRDWLTPGNILQAAGIAIIVALWAADRAVPAGAGPPDLRDAVGVLGTLAPWLVAVLLLVALVRLVSENRRLQGRVEVYRETVKAAQVLVAQVWGLAESMRQELEDGDDSAEDDGRAVGCEWLEGWNEGAGKLLLKHSDLEVAYDRARVALESKGLRAGLSCFVLTFLPFRRPPLLTLSFDFISPEAEQEYEVEVSPARAGSVSALEASFDPKSVRRPLASDEVFAELPWRVQPHWAELVRVAALRHGPLAADRTCTIKLMAQPQGATPSWSVSVMDFGNRCLSIYDGTCPEDLKPSHDRAWLAPGPVDDDA